MVSNMARFNRILNAIVLHKKPISDTDSKEVLDEFFRTREAYVIRKGFYRRSTRSKIDGMLCSIEEKFESGNYDADILKEMLQIMKLIESGTR